MGVKLREIARDDVLPLLQLTVADAQRDFIVHNAITLAQAAFEPNTCALGIWADDTLVGLTTLVDMRAYPYIGPDTDPNSGYIWRIMVGDAHQRRGHARAALREVEAWAQDRHLAKLFVATVQTNVGALKLYRSMGFRPTGKMVAGEMEMSKPLAACPEMRKTA